MLFPPAADNVGPFPPSLPPPPHLIISLLGMIFSPLPTPGAKSPASSRLLASSLQLPFLPPRTPGCFRSRRRGRSANNGPWAKSRPVPVFPRTGSREHRPTHLSVCHLWLLSSDNGSRAVLTETVWPSKLKIFTLWSFTESLPTPGLGNTSSTSELGYNGSPNRLPARKLPCPNRFHTPRASLIFPRPVNLPTWTAPLCCSKTSTAPRLQQYFQLEPFSLHLCNFDTSTQFVLLF